MKVCHLCGDTYKECVDFCFNDGEVLLPVEAAEDMEATSIGPDPVQINRSPEIHAEAQAAPAPAHESAVTEAIERPTPKDPPLETIPTPNVGAPLVAAEVSGESFDEVVFTTNQSQASGEVTEATEATAPMPGPQTSEAVGLLHAEGALEPIPDEDRPTDQGEPPEVTAAAAMVGAAAGAVAPEIAGTGPSAETKPFPIPRAAVDAPERPTIIDGESPSGGTDENGEALGLAVPGVGGPPSSAASAASAAPPAPPPPVPSTVGQTLPLTELSPPQDLDATAPRGRPMTPVTPQVSQARSAAPPPLDSHPHLSMPVAADATMPVDGGDRTGLVMLGIGVAGLVMLLVLLVSVAIVGMGMLSGESTGDETVTAVTTPLPRRNPQRASTYVPMGQPGAAKTRGVVTVTIPTEPQGTTIEIDGNVIMGGQTVSLDAGHSYPYTISMPGFITQSHELTLPPLSPSIMVVEPTIGLTEDDSRAVPEPDPLEVEPLEVEPSMVEAPAPRPAPFPTPQPQPGPEPDQFSAVQPAPPTPTPDPEDPPATTLTVPEPAPAEEALPSPIVTVVGGEGCRLMVDQQHIRASDVSGATKDGEAVLPMKLLGLRPGVHKFRVVGSGEACDHPERTIDYKGEASIVLPAKSEQ